MKIVYGITVSTEEKEIIRLVEFLIEKGQHDIVVQYDNTKDNLNIIEQLKNYKIELHGELFENDFASFKNKLTEKCVAIGADYIFQLDADEMVSEYIADNIEQIIEMNPEIDLFFLPRINTVDGITTEHIKQWRWKLDEGGRINFPDYQGRIFKSKLKWEGKVHEKISGARFYSILPLDEEYCLIHKKTITRQEKQNSLYNNI